MAAVSRANVRLCGSHAGVSIGEDGPSQMGLEDLAMMRAVHGSTVFYPCCANQTAKLVAAMAEEPGVLYLRTTREATPVIYGPNEEFARGGSKVLRRSPADRVTLVAAGITLHEALVAHARLAEHGLPVRVIDAYSVKPIDRTTIREAAMETDAMLVIEDHWREGGLGDAVRECLSGLDAVPARVIELAVSQMPGSGTGAELLAAAGIDAHAIVRAVLRATSVAREAPAACCYLCGAPATWRIAVAGEDDAPVEEDACDDHARGHLRVSTRGSSVTSTSERAWAH
jgi:transketolase